ncbi:hypothetical protein V5O48_007137 [Marasmius crinis-equi]|uniref:Uncharacterized protein n=1 Tax=Marasmius crinis-equi TaxID=585013 RepID=A0ABR3FHJ8_9AGAR
MTEKPRHDDKFYLDVIVFLVDGVLFKIPSRYLHGNSEGPFACGSQISASSDSGEGSSDENPVVLSALPHNCNSDDFARFSKIVMALTVDLPTPPDFTLKHWLSILKLSTAWCFSEIRELAMKRVNQSQHTNITQDEWVTLLDFCHDLDQFRDLRAVAIERISAYGPTFIDKILMGRMYHHKSWAVEGLTDLVNNYNGLPPLAELKVLGTDTVLTLLYMIAKNCGQNVGYHFEVGYYTPIKTSYDASEVEGEFRDELAIYFPR